MTSNLSLLGDPFPVLRKQLDFGDFHEDLRGNYVSVWLNLSSEFEEQVGQHQQAWAEFEQDRKAHVEQAGKIEQAEWDAEQERLLSRAEEMSGLTAAVYSQLWDCTVEQYTQLVALDGALTDWLFRRTWEIIGEYRRGRAKVLSG